MKIPPLVWIAFGGEKWIPMPVWLSRIAVKKQPDGSYAWRRVFEELTWALGLSIQCTGCR